MKIIKEIIQVQGVCAIFSKNIFHSFQPYSCREGAFSPPYRKMAITPKDNDPKEPKICYFSYITMTNPPIPFLGLKMAKKHYSIFVVSGTNFRIINFGFLVFFEAKMTKIVILDQKLNAPDDYQQF